MNQTVYSNASGLDPLPKCHALLSLGIRASGLPSMHSPHVGRLHFVAIFPNFIVVGRSKAGLALVCSLRQPARTIPNKLADDPDCAAAQFNYADCLSHGRGVGIDLDGAAHYYKLAADQNHAAAQCTYGFCLCHGEGVGIDLEGAARYFRMAADQNYPQAQFNYGLCLYRGEGVGIEDRKSVV
jgi:TPR repeat protein